MTYKSLEKDSTWHHEHNTESLTKQDTNRKIQQINRTLNKSDTIRDSCTTY